MRHREASRRESAGSRAGAGIKGVIDFFRFPFGKPVLICGLIFFSGRFLVIAGVFLVIA
jgi:hypothetical protein